MKHGKAEIETKGEEVEKLLRALEGARRAEFMEWQRKREVELRAQMRWWRGGMGELQNIDMAVRLQIHYPFEF